jgi:hypothetical protein
MCCAIVALSMALFAGWRGVSGADGGRAGWLRRIAIAVMAIAMGAGSAVAADKFAAGARGVVAEGSVLLCGHFFR